MDSSAKDDQSEKSSISVKTRARKISRRVKTGSEQDAKDDGNSLSLQKRKPVRASMRNEISIQKRMAMLNTGEPNSEVKKKSVRVRKSVRKSAREGPDEEMRKKFRALGAKEKTTANDGNQGTNLLHPEEDAGTQRSSRESVRLIKTSLSTRRRAFLTAQQGDSPGDAEEEEPNPRRVSTRKIRVKSVRKTAQASSADIEETEKVEDGSTSRRIKKSVRVRPSQVRGSLETGSAEGETVDKQSADTDNLPLLKPRKLRLSRIMRFKGDQPGGNPVVESLDSQPPRKVSVRRVRRSIKVEPQKHNNENNDEAETAKLKSSLADGDQATSAIGGSLPNRKVKTRISRRSQHESSTENSSSLLPLPGEENSENKENVEGVTVGRPRKLRVSKYVKFQDKSGTSVRRVVRASAKHTLPLAERIKALQQQPDDTVEEKKDFRKKYLEAFNDMAKTDANSADSKSEESHLRPARKMSKRIVIRRSCRGAPSLRTRTKQLQQAQEAPDEEQEMIKQKRLEEAVESITKKPLDLSTQSYEVAMDSDDDRDDSTEQKVPAQEANDQTTEMVIRSNVDTVNYETSVNNEQICQTESSSIDDVAKLSSSIQSKLPDVDETPIVEKPVPKKRSVTSHLPPSPSKRNKVIDAKVISSSQQELSHSSTADELTDSFTTDFSQNSTPEHQDTDKSDSETTQMSAQQNNYDPNSKNGEKEKISSDIEEIADKEKDNTATNLRETDTRYSSEDTTIAAKAKKHHRKSLNESDSASLVADQSVSTEQQVVQERTEATRLSDIDQSETNDLPSSSSSTYDPDEKTGTEEDIDKETNDVVETEDASEPLPSTPECSSETIASPDATVDETKLDEFNSTSDGNDVTKINLVHSGTAHTEKDIDETIVVTPCTVSDEADLSHDVQNKDEPLAHDACADAAENVASNIYQEKHDSSLKRNESEQVPETEQPPVETPSAASENLDQMHFNEVKEEQSNDVVCLEKMEDKVSDDNDDVHSTSELEETRDDVVTSNEMQPKELTESAVSLEEKLEQRFDSDAGKSEEKSQISTLNMQPNEVMQDSFGVDHDTLASSANTDVVYDLTGDGKKQSVDSNREVITDDVTKEPTVDVVCSTETEDKLVGVDSDDQEACKSDETGDDAVTSSAMQPNDKAENTVVLDKNVMPRFSSNADEREEKSEANIEQEFQPNEMNQDLSGGDQAMISAFAANAHVVYDLTEGGKRSEDSNGDANIDETWRRRCRAKYIHEYRKQAREEAQHDLSGSCDDHSWDKPSGHDAVEEIVEATLVAEEQTENADFQLQPKSRDTCGDEYSDSSDILSDRDIVTSSVLRDNELSREKDAVLSVSDADVVEEEEQSKSKNDEESEEEFYEDSDEEEYDEVYEEDEEYEEEDDEDVEYEEEEEEKEEEEEEEEISEEEEEETVYVYVDEDGNEVEMSPEDMEAEFDEDGNQIIYVTESEEEEEIGSDEEVVYVDEDGNYVDADGNPIDPESLDLEEDEDEVLYMDEDGNYVDADGNIVDYVPGSDDEIIEE